MNMHSDKAEGSCISCGGGLAPFHRGIFDIRFGVEGVFDIHKCSSCGLVQIWPLPAPDSLKQLYETYYNFGGGQGGIYTRFRQWLFSSWLYKWWLALDGDVSFHTVSGSGRLLDIGCNEGRGLEIFSRNGFDAEGLELNEKAAAEARQKGFKVHAALLEEFMPEQPYDTVVMSNVLEHSLEPREMLRHAARILKPGGQIWISCPNADSWQRALFGKAWINWHVPFHVVHFTGDTLKAMLEQEGFMNISIRHKTPALWFAQSAIAKMFGRKGEPNRKMRNIFLVTGLMLLARAFSPVLWLGNRAGRGDCLVAVARKA